jgi:hypothetical protein
VRVPRLNQRQSRLGAAGVLLSVVLLTVAAAPRGAASVPPASTADEGVDMVTTPPTADPTPPTASPSASTTGGPDSAAPPASKAATQRVAATPTQRAATTKPATPASGARLTLGIWAGQPWEPWRLDGITSLLGRSPSLFLTYVGWDRPFTASDEEEIARRGASHVVTWEPNGYTLASIANGDHDAFIRDWASGAAAWGGRIYLRPMHEMNGDWYDWGRGVNGNTPSDFIRAWRHMHDIFVQQGATNVKWVWSPNVTYGSQYPLADLYPGNAYVDWLGLDGYNWGLDPHLGHPTWQSFADIFGATYAEVTALAPGKPLMIAETASTENGGNKAEWILTTFLHDIPRYPALRAAIWFNEADGVSNFRVDSSPAALAAFKQVFYSPTYSAPLP